ncbi:MAG TPA: gamma-glutamyltransferase, partial [Gemmatimonadaceae bacterium]|nr:gamma-glutamyltransferase [Gemmatimonadaceae bacterium]
MASNDSLATAVGAQVLREGGNAVDAAVATAFALAVTHPEAGNIGGGGFMLVRLANGSLSALDFRERAPAAAARDMFSSPAARRDASTRTHLASGVPGSVAGLLEALQRFGTITRTAAIAPSLRLAREGFVVDRAFVAGVAGQRARIAPYAGAPLFLPGGEPPPLGSIFRQADLARTLELIARDGADAFYRGAIGGLIVAEMRRGGGLITAADLAAYRTTWRAPLETSYRGHAVIGMPPPSAGGIAVAAALNVLESFESLPPFGTARAAHLVAAAQQRAFVDRNERIGDPDASAIPTELLVSKTYARRLARTIDPHRATSTRAARAAMREGNETTHISVADRFGNVVALTTTINDIYGSGVFVEGAGFFLNDEMDDFASRPGTASADGIVAAEANAIAPGKVMMSSMAPTIVLDRRGRVLLVVGSRGGPRIISSVLQVIVNVIDHRMPLADAVAAPRLHHVVSPDSLWHEPRGFAPAVIDSLGAMGYALRPIRTDTLPYIGRVIAVGRRGDRWEGVADPRYAGSAAG